LPDWWLIVASGPSLTRDDCDALRVVEHSVAVNCAVFMAPWAEYLFAADNVWWRFYGPKVEWYKGRRVSRTARMANIERWKSLNWQRTGGNSGHMAIQYAIEQGAKQVALLGFDQQRSDGKAHFHADHPREAEGRRTNMANAGGVASWPRLMAKTAMEIRDRGVYVVNLSRATALKCFPRMTVETFLEKYYAD
jgi:hypothetical protein